MGELRKRRQMNMVVLMITNSNNNQRMIEKTVRNQRKKGKSQKRKRRKRKIGLKNGPWRLLLHIDVKWTRKENRQRSKLKLNTSRKSLISSLQIQCSDNLTKYSKHLKLKKKLKKKLKSRKRRIKKLHWMRNIKKVPKLLEDDDMLEDKP